MGGESVMMEKQKKRSRNKKKVSSQVWIDGLKTVEEILKFNMNLKKIKEEKNIAIISEAGCPGIADPGQVLIAAAQEMKATIKPLVGPSSILLALMASGMNGQQFEFVGYLPIDSLERNKSITALETTSQKKNSTQIFIETPYRNNQLLENLLKTCKPSTKLCIAAELTAPSEFIKTKTIGEWKKEITDFHKKPVIFLLYAGI